MFFGPNTNRPLTGCGDSSGASLQSASSSRSFGVTRSGDVMVGDVSGSSINFSQTTFIKTCLKTGVLDQDEEVEPSQRIIMLLVHAKHASLLLTLATTLTTANDVSPLPDL